MDLDTIGRHIDIVNKHYPGLNLVQLGTVTLLLGTLRAVMGHESAKGTIDNYIHAKQLSPDVRQCLDYIEREVLGIKKSRIDIDYWKHGNQGEFRRSEDKIEIPRHTRHQA